MYQEEVKCLQMSTLYSRNICFQRSKTYFQTTKKPTLVLQISQNPQKSTEPKISEYKIHSERMLVACFGAGSVCPLHLPGVSLSPNTNV
jgi:hypothetical protein